MNHRDCPPILFLIFNRPDLTRRVFARIREARPPRLFIAADGPRQYQPGEYELCEQARKFAKEVDWPCEVSTLFREKNLGCGKAVSEAITWFFEQEQEGIILEDDCLPHPAFFRFCNELLERYRDDERVAAISGDNFQKKTGTVDQSYYFSIYFKSWGWATWRRAWQHYDWGLSQWPRLRNTAWLRGLFNDPAAVRYWQRIFDMVHAGQIDTWDFQWTYSCWIQSGLTVLPSVNLVTNIGFNDRGTHTWDQKNAMADLPATPMEFPLWHPLHLIRDFAADRYDTRHVFGVKPIWIEQILAFLRSGFHLLPVNIQKIIDRLRA